MATDGVARLVDQLQKLQPKWKQAFDGWVNATGALRSVLQNLERALDPDSPIPPERLERERFRLEAVVRLGELQEQVARTSLAQIERLEQHRSRPDTMGGRPGPTTVDDEGNVGDRDRSVRRVDRVRLERINASGAHSPRTRGSPLGAAPGPWRPDILGASP